MAPTQAKGIHTKKRRHKQCVKQIIWWRNMRGSLIFLTFFVIEKKIFAKAIASIRKNLHRLLQGQPTQEADVSLKVLTDNTDGDHEYSTT